MATLFAFANDVLGDPIVVLRAGGHLRRMGYGEHLSARSKTGEALSHGVGDCAADSGVDLVENQGWRRSTLGEPHFDRQQKTRELPARSDFHQRSEPRARIGADEEVRAIITVGRDKLFITLEIDPELGALEFQRRKLGGDRLLKFIYAPLAGDTQPTRSLRVGRPGVLQL